MLALAAVGLLFEGWRLSRRVATGVGEGFAVVATTLVVLILCLAPAWIGGARFAAVQGNQWDQFSYLSVAALAKRMSYSAYNSAQLWPFLAASTAHYLGVRPAVELVYAAMTGLFDQTVTSASYAYRAAIQTLMLPASLFLLANVTAARLPIRLLIAAGIALGFAMQFVFDINAWSNLAGLPVAFLAVGILVVWLGERAASRRDGARLATALAIVLSGFFYLYPDVTALLAASFGGAAVAWVMADRWRPDWPRVWPVFAALGLALLVCLVEPEGAFGAFIRQSSYAINNVPDWWKYFFAYLQQPGPVEQAASALGLYFWVLPAAAPALLVALWRVAVGGFIVGLLGAAVAAIATAPREIRRALLIFAGSVLALLAAVAILALTDRLWAAGKALAWASPSLLFLLLVPLTLARPGALAKVPAAIMLAAQLSFGLYRLIAAGAPSGIHYPPPYPATQSVALKADYRWDLDTFRGQIEACHGVSIDVANPFLERYVALFLVDIGAKWSSARPYNPYFGTAANLGMMPQIDADCLVTDHGDPARPPGGTVIDLVAG